MIRRWLPLLLLLAALGGALGYLLTLRSTELPPPDLVAANEIAAVAAEQWPAPAESDFPDGDLEFTVVDEGGAVLAHRGAQIADPLQAFRARAATLPVTVGGEQVGSVYVIDPAIAAFASERDRLLSLTTVVLAAVALLATGLYAWAILRIVAPFHRLRAFARQVAGGRFDVPLPMDRRNAFGAFTESFDLMRDEISRARADEAAAKAAKVDLLAQLSHDIRTPVATIEATAELLEVGEHAPERVEKLRVIRGKTRQIDELVGELFAANADEVDSLEANRQTVRSTMLEGMLRAADPDGLIRKLQIEEVLIDIDPRRMQQIADNLLDNVRKYAGGPVDVSARSDGPQLALTLRDYGPGVPDAEIDLVVAKGYRAANVGPRPGRGLGLYTARQLAERMGGSLVVANRSPGFEVRIELPISL